MIFLYPTGGKTPNLGGAFHHGIGRESRQITLQNGKLGFLHNLYFNSIIINHNVFFVLLLQLSKSCHKVSESLNVLSYLSLCNIKPHFFKLVEVTDGYLSYYMFLICKGSVKTSLDIATRLVSNSKIHPIH